VARDQAAAMMLHLKPVSKKISHAAQKRRWKAARSGSNKRGKRRIIMANVQTKSGGYTIPARKTQEFTFWWGDGYRPTAYFNVSIEPNAEGLDLIPLIEEGRKTTTIAPKGLRQPQLILTLRNNNHFDVPFFANHILVSI
jgi:hypothetical protein